MVRGGLIRRFGGAREVLRGGIDLDVGYGVIATLLGPNGAGKTTLIRILTTELMPHGGEAYVAGFNVVSQASEVRRRIAVIPQDARPISYMTPPHEFVYSYLLLRGLPRNDARKAVRDSLEELGLWDLRNTPIYQLSGGMTRRVLVAAVLASNAEVVFLDEPTVGGLDAASRRVVWNSLRRYSNSGASIFLTTHYIEEAEQISDMVFLIDSGLIVSRGRPSELVNKLPGKYVVEYPASMSNGSCIRVGSSCFSFVDSLDEVGDGAIRVSPKSLEHYVLVTVRSWVRRMRKVEGGLRHQLRAVLVLAWLNGLLPILRSPLWTVSTLATPISLLILLTVLYRGHWHGHGHNRRSRLDNAIKRHGPNRRRRLLQA